MPTEIGETNFQVIFYAEAMLMDWEVWGFAQLEGASSRETEWWTKETNRYLKGETDPF